jgi:DNA adenine methylase
MTKIVVAKAFVKYCGGKARHAAQIIQRLPSQMNTYYEPFVGGGAVFFKLAQAKRFQRAIISDTNTELMSTWLMIQQDVEKLIKALHKPQFKYNKTAYLKIRAQNPDKLSPINQAARFLYLNKTCFNGLYRVNSKGKFNTPFGKYEKPVICDADNLRAVSALLHNVTILNGDFEAASANAKLGDGAYLDPPYIPSSKTSKFTSYTQYGFTNEDHERLARVFELMGNRGCRVVLSNSDTPLTHKLYDKYDIDSYIGLRSVGGPAEYRKPIKELLIFHGPRNVEAIK